MTEGWITAPLPENEAKRQEYATVKDYLNSENK